MRIGKVVEGPLVPLHFAADSRFRAPIASASPRGAAPYRSVSPTPAS